MRCSSFAASKCLQDALKLRKIASLEVAFTDLWSQARHPFVPPCRLGHLKALGSFDLDFDLSVTRVRMQQLPSYPRWLCFGGVGPSCRERSLAAAKVNQHYFHVSANPHDSLAGESARKMIAHKTASDQFERSCRLFLLSDALGKVPSLSRGQSHPIRTQPWAEGPGSNTVRMNHCPERSRKLLQ